MRSHSGQKSNQYVYWEFRLDKAKKRQKEEDNLDIQPSKVKNHQQHVEFLQKFVYNAYMSKYTINEKE